MEVANSSQCAKPKRLAFMVRCAGPYGPAMLVGETNFYETIFIQP